MNRSIASAALICGFLLAVPTIACAQLGGGKGGAKSATAPMLGSSPSLPVSCKVDAVDAKAFQFSCTGQQGSQTYQVYSTTVFQLGTAGSSFYDLKTGMAVQVQTHISGTTIVADSVATSP